MRDLLERMTLDEKLAQLSCVWTTDLLRNGRFDRDAAADKLRHGVGQVTRIGASTALEPHQVAALTNEIQHFVVEETRLGIPMIVHEESVGGFCARGATVFPQALGLASTWDPDLVEQVAAVIREQLRAVGARHTLAPVLDVARDPRWGRVEETYGEDPVLCGTIGTAYVRGLQTQDLAGGVVATGKHFLAYALAEGGRNQGTVQLGPRELREVYAEPFAAAIRDAGLASVMNSYGSVDGLPCASSRAILTDLLRGELGFDGVVVADYFSVDMLTWHHQVAGTKGEAAVRALTAGLDMELPAADCFGQPLRDELEAGRIEPSVVDRAVERVLRVKAALGLFEQPYVDPPPAIDTPGDRALARRAVARSAVLLANDGILPLATDTRVAVIGPVADDPRLLQGDYHYPAHLEIIWHGPDPVYTPHATPLAAISENATGVLHARGCTVTGEARAGIADAVAAARASDVAVVLLGGRSGLHPTSTVGEARDAVDLDLTGVQGELFGAVVDTGTRVVLVVVSGRVHTLGPLVSRANATLLLWPPGEEGGTGLADVLFGRVNPAGRLPVSLPRAVGQVPVYSGQRAGGAQSRFYGDYTDCEVSPLFGFGHGLSYTTFAYDGLSVAAGSTREPVSVSVDVTNTGGRGGDEVVQLYATDEVASVARRRRALIGFARVPIEAGATRRVSFRVDPTRLAGYDERMRFVVEPGTFRLEVGASSTDIRAVGTVELTGEVAEYRQRDVVATAVGIV